MTSNHPHPDVEFDLLASRTTPVRAAKHPREHQCRVKTVLLRPEAASITMLPSSVRRVVVAAPQSPTVSSLASAVPRAAASYSLPYRPTGLHQRRYSSSKPSSPDDGSKDFAARPVPASRGSKSEKSKGQAKAAVPQPPSVPSTRHIGDEGLSAQHAVAFKLSRVPN